MSKSESEFEDAIMEFSPKFIELCEECDNCDFTIEKINIHAHTSVAEMAETLKTKLLIIFLKRREFV